jgi:aminodeoxyfutalosine synthase
MATLLTPSQPTQPQEAQLAYIGQNAQYKALYHKILAGERVTAEEAHELAESYDLLALGVLADTARKVRTPLAEQDYVYWVHNYHINITNICEGSCKFCAFKRGPSSPTAYFMEVEQIVEQVKQYPRLADLTEFHVVSGLYERLNLEFFVELFKALKSNFPHVHIKGLTAVEVDYVAKLAGLSIEETLDTLMAAGLGSMPGGGAEVFSERIRHKLFPKKIPHWEWLNVHGIAHSKGLNSNVTMLAGLGETWQERVEHLLLSREQQDKSGGFKTLIPLNCWYENTAIDPIEAGLTGFDNLKLFALSRIIVDNIANLKGYWVQHGTKLAQVSLSFGVNDLDGTVTQEKISHNAGTDSAQSVSEAEFIHMIRRAGKTPVERDTLFNIKRIIQ